MSSVLLFLFGAVWGMYGATIAEVVGYRRPVFGWAALLWPLTLAYLIYRTWKGLPIPIEVPEVSK